MALQPVSGGDAASHPFRLVGAVSTTRSNNDGTFTPVVNITCQSTLYGVVFTFTILQSTFDTDGGPPIEAERTAWVDEICGHAHVVDFRSETDQGPSQVLYNYGVITVGNPEETATTEVRQRMDHLNDPSTFGMIDEAYKRLVAAGL
jgi:hypothetical protein